VSARAIAHVGSQGCVLDARGRDVEAAELAIAFDARSPGRPEGNPLIFLAGGSRA